MLATRDDPDSYTAHFKWKNHNTCWTKSMVSQMEPLIDMKLRVKVCTHTVLPQEHENAMRKQLVAYFRNCGAHSVTPIMHNCGNVVHVRRSSNRHWDRALASSYAELYSYAQMTILNVEHPCSVCLCTDSKFPCACKSFLAMTSALSWTSGIPLWYPPHK